jgi:hypothetical protein
VAATPSTKTAVAAVGAAGEIPMFHYKWHKH